MQSVKLQMEVMDSIAPWLLRANIGVVQTGAIGLHVAGFLSASICLPRFWPFHSNLKLCFCVPLVANWCNVPWRHQLGVTCVGGLPWVSQHLFSVSLVVPNGFGEQSSKMQHWLCSLCLSWCSYSIMCASHFSAWRTPESTRGRRGEEESMFVAVPLPGKSSSTSLQT